MMTAVMFFVPCRFITHNIYIFYFQVIAVYIMQCAGYCGASTLMVSLVQIYAESFPTIARVTRDQLIASSVSLSEIFLNWINT